eukprot:jgi/Mesvir1/20005/Mv13260-RA.1
MSISLDSDDISDIVLCGVNKGWSVSMNRHGDLIFEKPSEETDTEDDVSPRALVRPAPVVVERCESPVKERRKKVQKMTQYVSLDSGKRMRLSIKVSEEE